MIHIVSCTFRTTNMVYDHRHVSGGGVRVTSTESGRDLVKCSFFGLRHDDLGVMPANDVLSQAGRFRASERSKAQSLEAEAMLARHMAEARRASELVRMIEGALTGGMPRQDHP